MVTLRSGREIESRKEKEKKKTEKVEEEETGKENKLSSSDLAEETEKEKVQIEQRVEREELKKKEDKQAYMSVVPFPQRLQKAKIEEKFSRFLYVFKKIEINVPFSEALTQMPTYAKFFKDILSNKRNFEEKGVVNLTTTCSVVIQRSLSEKMQDPGSFTILCTIGIFEFKKALCGSGAIINLMPLLVVKRLSLGELTPTTMTLQMADKVMAQPEGVLGDVLIKVGKFIFPMDFIVMDMEEDTQVPLLLP